MSPAAASVRNPRALKVTLIAAAALGLMTIDLLMMGTSTGAWAFAIAIALALIPLPYYVALGLWADRYEPESYRLLLMTFLWGAGVAAFLAGFLNGAGTSIVVESLGEDTGEFYGGSISAPIVEEGLKGSVLFILWWRTTAINSVLDGIIFALMSGLGFAFVEEISYYSQEAAEGGFPAAFTHFIGRGLLLGLMHPVFTALTGIGIGLAVISQRNAVKWIAPAAGLVAAMLLHSLHNSMAGNYVELQYWLLVPLTFFTLIGIVVLSLRRQGKIVREHVPPEVLPPVEASRLFSIRGRISGFVEALRKGGLGGVRARDEYVRAISELAWQRYHSAGPGASSEKRPSEVEASYRERLRRVREAST
ncbi:MAG: PrsW family intramembrane metalloprotease [Actinomycetota bacterium]|nr:PrsW family intramembrane metalloprotease [Actinomycetota bacterium]